MTTDELYQKWCCGNGGVAFSPKRLESLRRALSGTFGHRVNSEPWAFDPNIVTNEGLDHILTSGLVGGTQIATWYLAAIKTLTTPQAGMQYAGPVFTEVVGSDVAEATRQVWTPGAVSSQAVDNTAAKALYTAATSLTLYAAALVGGGTTPTTLADTAGGGTMFAMGLFSGGSRALTVNDTIELSYTMGSADDGV